MDSDSSASIQPRQPFIRRSPSITRKRKESIDSNSSIEPSMMDNSDLSSIEPKRWYEYSRQNQKNIKRNNPSNSSSIESQNGYSSDSRPRPPNRKKILRTRKRHDTDSEIENTDQTSSSADSSSNESENSNIQRDTRYATTMIEKSTISTSPIILPVNPYNSICQDISMESGNIKNKSKLPLSLFDTSFQKTQDFLIKGPQALNKETKARRFRVRSGGKTKRKI